MFSDDYLLVSRTVLLLAGYSRISHPGGLRKFEIFLSTYGDVKSVDDAA